MTPLETYLRELRDIRSSGAAVEETASYSALTNLLTELGKQLKPKVRCITGLQDLGAGFPDGGLFTEEQFDKKHTLKPLPGQLPSRGVIEVKPVKNDAWTTAEGEQVSRYWGKYRQVLVTNYRDFVLVGQDAEGKPAKLETFRLADSEKMFWAAAQHPRSLAEKIGARFEEYLLRVMRHAAPIAAPEDVAWFLASYARDARARLEGVELPALATVRAALEEALGLKFEGTKGEHFFRSSLVQTLFYGVFSAWVLWAKQNPPASKARFDWYTTARYLRVPMISKLFHLVADPQELETLKLTEVLDWAALVLNRVDRRSFFDKFQESHAVQYFYEPFLEAFDPELRYELGVWYTPPEIVKYMVERVDTVLRQELGLADGLADKRVYVLDPCCGTGSYLVEVLDRIHRTLKEHGEDALLAHDLKEAAQQRIFGFEIMPAPFVVSHLQLGLLLQNLGAPLSEKSRERVGVYLTNALTGWEPPKGPKAKLLFPELEEERDAAEHVKREVPILVILGNPPYNSFAGIAKMEEERDLSEAYRTTKQAPAPQGQGLNDLYVRFFRMAERRIVEKTGRGVVCLISNYSWLDGLSFTGMRERYLEAFDHIWIDNLHGDRIISEYAPDGRTSETVFAVQGKSPGIKIGTSISLLVSKQAPPKSKDGRVFYRDLHQARADDRRQALIASLNDAHLVERYTTLEPVVGIGLPFKPRPIGPAYLQWPLLPDLFPVSFPGVQTSRDDLLVDIERARLTDRIQKYFNPEVSQDEIRHISPIAMKPTARFKPLEVREYLQKRGFLRANIFRHCYRPFDTRWLYWEPETKLLDEKRAEYFAEVFEGNAWIAAAQRNRKEFDPPLFTTLLSARHVVERGANFFPLYLKAHEVSEPLLASHETTDLRNLSSGARFNISDSLLAYLTCIGTVADAPNAFYHTLAILHAPAYRDENSGALRQDWPRVPLPDTKEALLASAALGKQTAALLDTQQDVATVRELPLQKIAAFTLPHGTPLKEAEHFAVTAGWGHAGKGGITMPGKGRVVERDYTPEERRAMGESALPVLGERTHDIYLNEAACWFNIPLRVWEYTIGGYQVIKKWLSYREQKLLSRPLTKDEVRYVQEMARRIAAILLLEPSLDANYRRVKEHTYLWKA